MEVIVFDDVTIGYDSIPVQEDMTFKVKKGEFWAIAGPNGTGKSTLVKTTIGLIPPLKGTVFVLGCPATHVCEHRKRIGYVPQMNEIDPMFPATALDIVLTGIFPKLGFFKRPSKHDVEKALKLMAEVGVADKVNASFKELSGGQKRRVLIARALMGDPEILIFDEPTAGVDIASEKQLVNLIARIHSEKKLTTLFVTHNVNPLLDYIDKVILLGTGFYVVGDKNILFNSEILQKVYGREVDIVCTPQKKYYIVPEDYHHE
jgi:ABC-type Mn2+/Zn2+ transport system ATPase subunit